MPARWRNRAATTLAVAGLVLVVPATASAAPGTWGAGHYPYLDGTVCHTGPESSPLAAWSVAGGQRGYLTQAVTSDGQVDSAAPPVSSAGRPQPPTDVTPGAGFATEQDIATVAYLLSTGGDAATLAAAVLTQTDPSRLPPCADTAAADALLARARGQAGPYQVTVSPSPGPARPAHPFAVTATVRTTAGDPVQGVAVQFSTGGGHFADDTVDTDAAGVARAALTVDPGSARAVTVQARASVVTGLRMASVIATPSATNPTGASVPAVFPATPEAFTGSATVPVDQAAHPVVSTVLDRSLFPAGSPLTPSATVSGLNGHRADVTFDLLGPLPLRDGTLCSSINPAAWSAANVHLADTSSVSLPDDGTAQGSPFTPAAAGCFAVRSKVATVDATPAVTRTAPLRVLAALDTTVSAPTDQPAVFSADPAAPAKLTGTLQVAGVHGLPGQIRLTFTGPITPADGDCATDAAEWADAARRTVTADAAAAGPPGVYQYSVDAPSRAGCYRVRPAYRLADPSGGSLTVAAGQDRAAYVLDPKLSAAVGRTWAVSPGAVPVQVSVAGLYGLAAHVRTVMYVTRAAPEGCERASFAGAARATTGPSAAVAGPAPVVTVAVRSGPTPRLGCYAVVPELTVDAAPQLRIAGPLGSAGATLIAGIDPNRHHTISQRPEHSGVGMSFVIAMGVLGAIVLIVIVRVGLLAWRDRDGVDGAPWPPGTGADPLALADEGLPSGP